MQKKAYADSTYRALAAIAKPYYPPADDSTPTNSWQHIQDVRRRAAAMMHKLYGRRLLPEEYAAILLHDSTKADLGGKNHGRTGAERAAALLLASKILDAQQAARAVEAIRVHDDNLASFPSQTAELLASADANPPVVDWNLNKAWNKHLKDPTSYADRYKAIAERTAAKYGTGGKFNYPGIYRKFYGKAVDDFADTMAALTPEEAERVITAYRKKHGFGMDELKSLHTGIR